MAWNWQSYKGGHSIGFLQDLEVKYDATGFQIKWIDFINNQEPIDKIGINWLPIDKIGITWLQSKIITRANYNSQVSCAWYVWTGICWKKCSTFFSRGKRWMKLQSDLCMSVKQQAAWWFSKGEASL